MLVDDDPMVLATMMRVSMSGGFTPLPCRSLDDVKCWFASGIVPSVVVTDVMLGRQNGVIVHDYVKSMSPETVVVFISGSPGMRGVSLPLGSRILPKPYDVERLLEALRSGPVGNWPTVAEMTEASSAPALGTRL